MTFLCKNYRLQRCNRLKSQSEFSQVFNRTQYKSNSNWFTIIAVESHLLYPRIGIIVGKKKIQKANRRNRIKRIVRESFRYNQSHLNGLDCVVIAKTAANSLTNSDVRVNLDKLWNILVNQFNR